MFSVSRDVLTLFYAGYLTNGTLRGGTKMLPQLLNQKSLEHQIFEIWCAGWYSPNFKKMVTAVVSKTDVIIAMTSQAVQTLYIGLFFDSEL